MLHRWHRRAGLAAAGFLMFLLVTGVPLQFSGTLGLGQRFVGAPGILDWYGLEAPQQVRASAGVVNVGDALFLAGSGHHVAETADFRGAVSLDGLTLAASRAEVLLLDAVSGELLDRFAMTAPVMRIGLATLRERSAGDAAPRIAEGAPPERVVVDTPDGLLMADAELVNWDRVASSPGAIHWAPLSEPAEPHVYRQRYRARMLTVERLLQDAHSGRLLGVPGVVLVDVASLLLLFLAVSGLLIWWRTLRR